MGIRFYCPNGHKIHVKAEFAGQRAKCPACMVGLEVPRESTITRDAPKLRLDNSPVTEKSGEVAQKPLAHTASPVPRVKTMPAAGLPGQEQQLDAPVEIPLIQVPERNRVVTDQDPVTASYRRSQARSQRSFLLVVALFVIALCLLGLLFIVLNRKLPVPVPTE